MDEQIGAVFMELLAYPVDLKPAPACSRCSHSAESHLHGDPLSCAHCALGPLAHAAGVGCSFYTPRTAPHSGASCQVPGCGCAGYSSRAPRDPSPRVGAQELSGEDGRQ